MEPICRATELEAMFAAAGFDGPLAVHVSAAPPLANHGDHPTPGLANAASPKRRSDFAIGRELAECGLAALKAEHCAVGRGPSRDPLWPSGFCGSITHTDGFAAAVVGMPTGHIPVGLGIDAEPIAGLDPDTCKLVLTHRERMLVLAQPAAERAFLETCLFSAKEALFKAQFPLTRRFVDFCEVCLEPLSASDHGRSGSLQLSHEIAELQGTRSTIFYRSFDRHLITGCVISGTR